MCKDLLKILSENFISDKMPVTGILKQIIINDEFKILKMFMDTEDRNGKNGWRVFFNGPSLTNFFLFFVVSAFEKLLKYAESNEPNADDLAFIKDKYLNWMLNKQINNK